MINIPTENEIKQKSELISLESALATVKDSILDQVNKAIKALIQVISEAIKIVTESFDGIVESLVKYWRSLDKQNRALTFGRCLYPKYYHYAVYSKKYRIRKKYMDRLIKLSLKRGSGDGRDVENAESDN